MTSRQPNVTQERARNGQRTLTVTLTATGDGPPAEVRMRRALKHLLRFHGLRASWPAGGKGEQREGRR